MSLWHGWLAWMGPEGFACLGALLVAALVTYLATFRARTVAFRLGAVDLPGGRRIHRQPTPRLGGLAIACGVVGTGVLLMCLRMVPVFPLLPILLTALVVCALGVVDDIRSVSPLRKILVLSAAGFVLALSGVAIEVVDLPGLGRIELAMWSIPLTVLWVLACTNAVNLIDGVDGVGSGVVMVAAGVVAALTFVTGQTMAAMLLCATCGAAAGFLVHNRQPARIFLGDSGSLLLGFLLAAASAEGCTKRATATALVATLAALSVPFLDTTQSFVRRFVRAWGEAGPDRMRRALKATAVADRSHIHHRLLVQGRSHRQVARILCLVTLLTGTTALLFIAETAASRLGLFAGLAAGVYALYRLASLEESRTEPTVLVPWQQPRSGRTPGEIQVILPRVEPMVQVPEPMAGLVDSAGKVERTAAVVRAVELERIGTGEPAGKA